MSLPPTILRVKPCDHEVSLLAVSARLGAGPSAQPRDIAARKVLQGILVLEDEGRHTELRALIGVLAMMDIDRPRVRRWLTDVIMADRDAQL